ncbi:MAG: hypothetical protein ACRECN_05435 [Methylocella sp.]
MMFAPLEGRRHVKVTGRRTSVDYARALKDLAEVHFPDAVKITLVQDNSPPAEAGRLVARFAWHSSPKHGSWLVSS